MSTRFFTNRRDNTLLAKFAGVFANNPEIRLFDERLDYLMELRRFRKDHPALIDNVLAAIRPYPLLDPSNPDLPDGPPADLSPDIILSESFA